MCSVGVAFCNKALARKSAGSGKGPKQARLRDKARW